MLDADLMAYYDAEALGGHRTMHGELRHGLREQFAAELRTAGCPRLVDVGAGPGLDTAEWQADGFEVVGLDLAFENARLMQQRDLRAVTGSLYTLPFRTHAFDALWTMSTFVHVPHDRFDEAITEMIRVVRPGGLLGIGTWGGRDFEGVPEFGDIRPYRFFSLAAHDRWHEMLARHAHVETFDTYQPTGADNWHYQFAILHT
jgi:SAM-dependent methyltransferase